MIRDITIGQYYQTKSVIHELDPRVKLMGTMVFIISLFFGKSIWMYEKDNTGESIREPLFPRESS